MAALASFTPVMKADDLSDLVAAVSRSQASAIPERSLYDGFSFTLEEKPEYRPSVKNGSDVDSDFLAGIEAAMTFHASLDYMLDLSGSADRNRNLTPRHDYTPYDRAFEPRPTLGRTDFFRPVPGAITSFYGWRPAFNRMHHGVDLRLNVGDTVRAALNGVVKKIAYDHDGYGNYVVMTHPDGMETIYGHLQYALVSQGQEVLSGSPVGIGGNTGNSTGPHLHFEAKIGGVAVDPTVLFDFYGRTYVSPDYTAYDPQESPAASKKSLKGKHTYVVRFGDTPKSVARRAGITLSSLCRLNMLKSTDRLEVGRMLKLK